MTINHLVTAKYPNTPFNSVAEEAQNRIKVFHYEWRAAYRNAFTFFATFRSNNF